MLDSTTTQDLIALREKLSLAHQRRLFRYMAKQISLYGGFRFVSSSRKNDRFYFVCSTDAKNVRHIPVSSAVRAPNKRRRIQRELFNCRSNLRFKQVSSSLVNVTFAHSHHAYSKQIQLTDAICDYIDRVCLIKSPHQIFHDIRHGSLANKDLVTKDQVYYRWQLRNSTVWKLDKDYFVSSSILLERAATNEALKVTKFEERVANVCSVGFLINDCAARVSKGKHELHQGFGK